MSLDSDNEEHSDTLGDIISGDMNADREMMKEDRKKEVGFILKKLNDRERAIVKMKFGIEMDYEMEFDGIAEKLNLGTERVRQIYNGAMNKLNKFMNQKI